MLNDARTRPITFALAAPVVAVCLLGAITWEKRGYVKPDDVEPYHAAAREQIEAWPHAFGYWTGSDHDIPTAAQRLLRPNVIKSRRYRERRPGRSERVADVLVVQCRDSRDMIGHYPPVCYRALGKTLVAEFDREWQVGDLHISGKEYQFTQRMVGQTLHTTIYNFFVVPDASGKPIKPDMDAVRDAAEDYQQRYYGAAQFQVVFNGMGSDDQSRPERDDVFVALTEPMIPMIKTLASGGLK